MTDNILVIDLSKSDERDTINYGKIFSKIKNVKKIDLLYELKSR